MEVVKSIQIGRFTIIQAKDTETGILGVGVARKSDLDRYSQTTAVNIATGRAMKAVELKKKNRKIQHVFLG